MAIPNTGGIRYPVVFDRNTLPALQCLSGGKDIQMRWLKALVRISNGRRVCVKMLPFTPLQGYLAVFLHDPAVVFRLP